MKNLPPLPKTSVGVRVRPKVIAHKNGLLEKTKDLEVFFTRGNGTETREWSKIIQDLGVQYLHALERLLEKTELVQDLKQNIDELRSRNEHQETWLATLRKENLLLRKRASMLLASFLLVSAFCISALVWIVQKW